MVLPGWCLVYFAGGGEGGAIALGLCVVNASWAGGILLLQKKPLTSKRVS